jgi:hypothetical protein
VEVVADHHRGPAAGRPARRDREPLPQDPVRGQEELLERLALERGLAGDVGHAEYGLDHPLPLGALVGGQPVEEPGNLLAQHVRRVVRPGPRQAPDQPPEEGVRSRRFIGPAPGLEPGLATFLAEERGLQLANEPGLAEPGVADQAHDGTESLPRPAERRAQRRHLAVPSHERPLVAGHRLEPDGLCLARQDPVGLHGLVLALDLDAAKVLELEQRANQPVRGAGDGPCPAALSAPSGPRR